MPGDINVIFAYLSEEGVAEADKEVQVRVPRNEDVGSLLQKWSTKSGLELSEHRFATNRRYGGTVLNDFSNLVSAYVDDEDQYLIVNVSKSVINVSVLQEAEIHCDAEFNNNTTVNDVIDDVCKKMGVPPQHASSARILYDERILERQELLKDLKHPEEKTKMTLDFCVRIFRSVKAFVEFEETEEENDDCDLTYNEVEYPDTELVHFISEDIAVLLLDCKPRDQQRLWLNDPVKPIMATDLDHLSDIIKFQDICAKTEFKLILECSGSVYIERPIRRSITMEEVEIWPTDTIEMNEKLKKLLKKRNGHLLWEGEVLQPNVKFIDADLQTGSILKFVSKFETRLISVRDSKGKCHGFQMNNKSTVLDLRAKVAKFEEHEDFIIACNGVPLSLETLPISVYEIAEQSTLQVTYETIKVKLHYEGQERELPKRLRVHGTIDELLSAASTVLEVDLPRDTMFQCVCGRKITLENRFQTSIPISCCSVEPKMITVHRPINIRIMIDGSRMSCRLATSERVEKLRSCIRRLLGGHSRNFVLRINGKRFSEDSRLYEVLEATNNEGIEVTVEDEELHIRLQVGREGRVFPWITSLDTSLSNFTDELEQFGATKNLMDVAIQVGNQQRPLHIRRDGRSETFRELGILKGMLLTLLEGGGKQHFSCQTEQRVPAVRTDIRHRKSQWPETCPSYADIQAPPTPVNGDAIFFIDCRHLPAIQDFKVNVPRTDCYIPIRRIRNEVLHLLRPQRGEIYRLEIYKGRTEEGNVETIYTKDGWIDSRGRVYLLSDIKSPEWHILNDDDPPIKMPTAHVIQLRIVKE